MSVKHKPMPRSESNLSVKVYENCYALPFRSFKSEDGVNLHGGGLCCEGVWIRESGLFPSSLASYAFDPDEAGYIDEDVVFIGCMSSVWGHAITDCLKHLWWLRTDEYKNRHQGKRLVYWGEKPLEGNFLELIRLADVEVSRLYHIDRPTRFKSVLVPDISFNYTEGWASQEYTDTIDLIISNCHPRRVDGVDKLFISEHESRRLWGVKSIEKVARSAGYRIYYPGEHSIREQISTFQSASTVLSFESSVGHNTVFCPPRTRIILLRKEDYRNRYQPVINRLREFDATVVDASLSIMNDKRYPYAGPFFVYPHETVCQAIRPSGPASEPFPWKAFKKYIGYNLWGGEDILAHRFVYSEEQARRIARAVSAYRKRQYSRISNLFRFIPLPRSIKDRAIKKLAKHQVRNLF